LKARRTTRSHASKSALPFFVAGDAAVEDHVLVAHRHHAAVVRHEAHVAPERRAAQERALEEPDAALLRDGQLVRIGPVDGGERLVEERMHPPVDLHRAGDGVDLVEETAALEREVGIPA
jgi:hypothetical protein